MTAGRSSKACSPVAPFGPIRCHFRSTLTAVIWTSGFLRCGPAGDITPSWGRLSPLNKDKSGRIACRVSPTLVEEAKRRTGIEADTDLIAVALANVALQENVAQAFRGCARQGRRRLETRLLRWLASILTPLRDGRDLIHERRWRAEKRMSFRSSSEDRVCNDQMQRRSGRRRGTRTDQHEIRARRTAAFRSRKPTVPSRLLMIRAILSLRSWFRRSA
jgi:hypothetical protein